MHPLSIGYNIPSAKSIEKALADPQIFAHRKITTWMGRAISHIENHQSLPVTALTALGVYEKDRLAQKAFFTVLKQLTDPSTQVVPSEGNPGVFLVQDSKGHPFAVAKVGYKRAAYEALIRELAVLLKLPERASPSMFCTINNFELDIKSGEIDPVAGSGTVEELWNGHRAFFVSEEESKKRLPNPFPLPIQKSTIACLQPFITSSTQDNPSQRQEKNACLLLLLLAGGIRDVRSDGIIGHTVVDAEQCFTRQNLPKPGEDRPAITDLLYLADLPEKELSLPLPQETLLKLQSLASAWNIDKIINSLKKEKVQFFDKRVENANPTEPNEEGNETFIHDEGGNCLMVVKQDKGTTIDPCRNHLDRKTNWDKKLLMDDQLSALKERLSKLKAFILSPHPSSYSLKELIFAVDPWAEAYYNTLIEQKTNGTINRRVALANPFTNIGRLTPIEEAKAFSPSDLEATLQHILHSSQGSASRNRLPEPLSFPPSPLVSNQASNQESSPLVHILKGSFSLPPPALKDSSGSSEEEPPP